jgi:hypothetical protein
VELDGACDPGTADVTVAAATGAATAAVTAGLMAALAAGGGTVTVSGVDAVGADGTGVVVAAELSPDEDGAAGTGKGAGVVLTGEAFDSESSSSSHEKTSSSSFTTEAVGRHRLSDQTAKRR